MSHLPRATGSVALDKLPRAGKSGGVPMTIEPLAQKHVSEVSALHSRGLRGLLADLGAPMVSTYHGACVDEPLATALVAVDGGHVLGFVSGSIRPRELKAMIWRKHPVAIAASV